MSPYTLSTIVDLNSEYNSSSRKYCRASMMDVCKNKHTNLLWTTVH